MNVIKGARVLFLSHASPSGIGWQSACPGPPVGGVSPQVKRETGTLNIRDWRHLHWKSWQQSPNFLTKNSGAVSLARQQWPCASHFPVSQGICRLSNVKLHLLIFPKVRTQCPVASALRVCSSFRTLGVGTGRSPATGTSARQKITENTGAPFYVRSTYVFSSSDLPNPGPHGLCMGLHMCVYVKLYWDRIHIYIIHSFKNVCFSGFLGYYRVVWLSPQSMLEYFHRPKKKPCTL